MGRAETIKKEIGSLLAATVALVVVLLITIVKLSGPACRYLTNGGNLGLSARQEDNYELLFLIAAIGAAGTICLFYCFVPDVF